MSAASSGPSLDIRYEPDERTPHLLSLGLGFQYALLVLAGIVLTPAIVIRAASQSEVYMSWAIFAALVICGLTTALQAARLWRIGSGHVLIMGTSGSMMSTGTGESAAERSADRESTTRISSRPTILSGWSACCTPAGGETRAHLINRKVVTFAQDRRPIGYLSDIYEIASSKTSSDTRRLHCLNLFIRFPRPFIAPRARAAGKSKRDDS